MALITYPTVLVPLTRNFRIDARSRSPGEGITGREQVQYAGLSRWLADVTVPLNRRDRILAAQALQAALRGRMNYTNVTFIAGVTAPRILPRINGVVYRGNKLVPPPGMKLEDLGVVPTLRSSVAADATTVSINPGTCEDIAAGCDFSLKNRLYRITSISPGTNVVATIEPKIREAVAAGTRVEFWRPSCLMGLVADDSMEFELQLGRFGNVSMRFVEYW